MNEPKVHMLKSGMIADKIVILLSILSIFTICIFLLIILQKNYDTEPIINTTTVPKK